LKRATHFANMIKEEDDEEGEGEEKEEDLSNPFPKP
jgi:hypothetical protein